MKYLDQINVGVGILDDVVVDLPVAVDPHWKHPG